MENHFNKVKTFLLDLEYTIIKENEAEQLFIAENLEAGITNLIIDCEDPLLIIEVYLFDIKNKNLATIESLLIKNRDIIHGAFALDDNGQKVFFRDTLQLENLDFNELQATLYSLELLLSEYAGNIIAFSK
ncbi:YbjN domain-containing protein [Mesonia aestuariivivens]|uniref:YbjN domain-containing protein n=1 Tax=Mesonia aestuariivivens TaxID=2796128 RepID=A0ABS6W1S7_9FLAO|nr:YbjN domain-containing protein [Mesonia aestuariivivens]MBW2961785.1 YbjN domain-containing protein [Mesonia aestuariivivens]